MADLRISAAVEAAVAQAAAVARTTSPGVVEQLDAGSLKPKGASLHSGLCRTQLDAAGHSVRQVFKTAVEAAVAADMTRLAVYSLDVSPQQLNFRPEMYQLQQVGEWAALLQQRQPDLPVAAWDTETAAEVAARASAERAAVSAAAEAAAAAQLASPAVAQELEGSKGNATSVKHGADRDVGSWRCNSGIKTSSWLCTSKAVLRHAVLLTWGTLHCTALGRAGSTFLQPPTRRSRWQHGGSCCRHGESAGRQVMSPPRQLNARWNVQQMQP